MRKPLWVFFLLFLSSFGAAAASDQPAPTPIVAPTIRHNPDFEISKHMAWQTKRIKVALKAGLITAEQARALRGLVTLSFKKTREDYWTNKKNWLTPAQEAEVFQLLTNSARAIDKAVGSTSPNQS